VFSIIYSRFYAGPELELFPGMATFFRRRLAATNDPPGTCEFSIALITVYAIVIAVLTCELVTRVGNDETKSVTPYTKLKTYNA
jgi:hypothetical protein